MTVKEVRDALNQAAFGSYSIELEFWHHDHRKMGLGFREELKWTIYISGSSDRFEGPTLENAYDQWLASRTGPSVDKAEEALKILPV